MVKLTQLVFLIKNIYTILDLQHPLLPVKYILTKPHIPETPIFMLSLKRGVWKSMMTIPNLQNVYVWVLLESGIFLLLPSQAFALLFLFCVYCRWLGCAAYVWYLPPAIVVLSIIYYIKSLSNTSRFAHAGHSITLLFPF